MNRKLNGTDFHRLVVCSDLRRNIILSLYESQKSLGELRDSLKICSTTAIHSLKELEKGNLTFQEKNARKYSLTNTGIIIAMKLIDFCNAAEVLQKHNIFWSEHDLSGIPHDLTEKIGWLKNSNLIVIDTLNIIKPHEHYISSLSNAKWIKGVTPIFSSDYSNAYKVLAEKNINIKLILSQNVLKKLIEVMGPDDLNYLINKHKVEIFVTDENLKVAFTVTDAFFSLGLFNNNGVYDISQDLISTDDMAIRWGHELFKYFQEKSKIYKI
jgi:predicted transcriptional regulator